MSAEEKGREEGRQDKRFAIAKNLLAAGIDQQVIQSSTGLSEEEIARLSPYLELEKP